MRTVRGGEHVAFVHRLTDADRDRFLADRDVEEAGKLARAELLFDLFLEAPDQEHLAQEIPQRLLVQRSFLLDLGHDARQCTFWAMSLVGQWRELETALPEGWVRVSVQLEIRDPGVAAQASALLGPAGPYRTGTTLRFSAARDGSAQGPDGIARLLRRLDTARIDGTLTALGSEKAAARVERERTSLVESWDAALAELPADWSDLAAEVRLLSTDYVEHAAVLCIQMNPRRVGDSATFRFRAARRAGYGVAPQMARRCLERCDEENIRGSVAVLRALSDTRLVWTQGPVWMLDGQTV